MENGDKYIEKDRKEIENEIKEEIVSNDEEYEEIYKQVDQRK